MRIPPRTASLKPEERLITVNHQGGIASVLVATAAFEALPTYIGFTLSVFAAGDFAKAKAGTGSTPTAAN